MSAAATKVTAHAKGPGTATITANQRLATSIVPWAHHRIGTASRSR